MKRKLLTGVIGAIWAAVCIVQVVHGDIKSAVLYGIVAAAFFISLLFKSKKESKE